MSARRFSGFLLLFLVLQTACSRLDNTRTRAPATRVPLAAAHQFYQVPIGLCEDYPEESRTLTSARKDLELLKRHQVPVLRIAFGWDAMEPERGRFDWSFWDEFVHLATEEYGLRLIPYICYTPAWAAARPGEDAWREPPADVNLFAAFVRQLVTRYRDKIDSWEIWNEPDNPHYWLGSVEQYAALLAAGSQAVRQADPHAKVVLGGLAWNLDFLEAMLTNSATMRDVDVVNLHNYYETWSSDAVEQLPQYVGRARDILKRHQRPLPIWMAEIGYSSYRQNGRVSPQFHPHLNYEHTPAHQANTLFRALTLLLATEQVDLVAWYRINDLPVKQDIIGDVNNRHLGLLNLSRDPKPALRAFHWATTLFGPGIDYINHQVHVTKRLASTAEVHTFKRLDGTILIIAWLPTIVHGQRGDPTGQTVDPRREVVSLQLPHKPRGQIAMYDQMGALQASIPAQQSIKIPLHGNATRVLIVQP